MRRFFLLQLIRQHHPEVLRRQFTVPQPPGAVTKVRVNMS